MYRVSLEDFEGPLDLLLHFIRRDELDVFDIPIARIAGEYLEHVYLLDQIDLDSAGEFLYMSAVLINVKARMLLPVQEIDEEGEPIDPRRELVERLLEYIRYKEASSVLEQLESDRAERFTRSEVASVMDGWKEDAPLDLSIFDLVSALRSILTEVPEDATLAVAREAYTVEEQQAFLLARLERGTARSFAEFVTGRSRPFVIAAFLGVLELAQSQRIRLSFEKDDPADFHLELI